MSIITRLRYICDCYLITFQTLAMAQSTTGQILMYDYDNIQWQNMPRWVKDGVTRFPFSTTFEAQTFADMLVLRLGTLIGVSHAIESETYIPWYMSLFVSEVVCCISDVLFVILMKCSWQLLDILGNATSPTIGSLTRIITGKLFRF